MNIKCFPNYEFYNVDKQSLINYKSINKRLSCNYLEYDYPEEEYYEVANTYILKNFYNLFNYISGEFTPNLIINPNTFTSCNSYVENKIQLGTKVFSSINFSQQDKVDSVYAIMIHEMWHKRYTNKDIVDNYLKKMDIKDFYNSKESLTIIKKILPNTTIGHIFNILEDRRIERLGLEEFPGFVFYFNKLRNYCVNIHNNKNVSEFMISSLIMEYLMFKILLPEMLDGFIGFINDLFEFIKKEKKTSNIKKTDILKCIEKLNNYIENNEKRVFSSSIVDLINVSKEIYDIIPANIKNDIEKDLNNSGKSFDGIFSDYTFSNDEEDYTDKNYTDEKVLSIQDNINKQIEKAEKKRDDLKNKEEETEKSRIEKINIIDCSKDFYKEVIIFNPKCKNIDNTIYNKSKKFAQNIAMNLGFIAAKLNNINYIYEQNEGDLDEDELHLIKYSKDIFYDELEEPGFELDLGFLVDESGSMFGEKIFNAIVATLGCTLSTKDSEHINLFIYGHSQGRHNNHKKGMVELYEYYNTKRNITEYENLYSISAKGGNADGYAIAKVCEIMMDDSKSKNKILIVISDGYPSAEGYGGESAKQHVKKVVNLLESKGIEIIQICIDNIENSSSMFNNFIPFDNMGNFIKKLKELLENKLIKFSENL